MEKVYIIGCGNMGGAIIAGMLNSGFDSSTITGIDVDSNKLNTLKEKYGINVSPDISSIKEKGIVIIAVKPNHIKSLLTTLKPVLKPNLHKLISIAAGIKIDILENLLENENFKIARCMPNIAAMVGESTTAICFNRNVSSDEKPLFLKIVNSIGNTFEIEERLFDVVTGLSGSGPAYVFYFIEALVEGGVLMGLARDKALNLALSTVSGSLKYLSETGVHPAIAKDFVTSPGGTTIEALFSLEKGAFKGLIIEAVKKATEKSIMLGK